jgi:general secretion pathway protein G
MAKMFNNTSKSMKKTGKHQSPQRGGFTLIEVMMVLFIIVMIASVGVVAVTGQRDKARQRTAFAYVKTLETAIDRYDGDMGRPPTNEQGLLALVQCPADVHNPDDWAGPYVKSTAISRDPWGSEYQYASPGRGDGRHFDIWSFGPDGIDGTDDDIGSWKGSLN